jgi:mono/diheme cytochrome c family protein
MAALILMGLLLSGCDESMDQQNRYSTYGAAGTTGSGQSWPAGGEALPLVEGTVAQGDAARADALAHPPAPTAALLARGRERYDIFCSACHGLDGSGNGIIVARGFPHPDPFGNPQVMAMDARRLLDVIGDGYGRMYGFGDRVDPSDRWAIVAYIRALQLVQNQKRSEQ